MPLPCKPSKPRPNQNNYTASLKLAKHRANCSKQLFFSKFGLGTNVNTIRYTNLYNQKKERIIILRFKRKEIRSRPVNNLILVSKTINYEL